MMNVCLLGCGGSMPVPGRCLTSLLISYNGSKILIDCGEGTQVSMKMVGWGFKNVDVICFTHYHADHVVGLPGLLLTIANSGRTEPLKIIGPVGLKKTIAGLSVLFPELPFDLDIYEFNPGTFYVQNNDVVIKTLPVQHGMPCFAFCIEVKRKRRFDVLKAKKNNVPVVLWSKLQKNDSIFYNDILYKSDMVLAEERRGLKVCYCTDTRPIHDIVEFIKNADLFVSEGMYGDDSDKTKAEKYNHMLFSEAAHLAKKGNVDELWLTHYSPSLVNPEDYIDNAKSIFKNTYLGEDRKIKELNFKI